jgi:regulator of protease activity HflC (stomatin/prohibitin superfamily)
VGSITDIFGSVPLANGNPFTGILNLVLAVLLGAFGKGSVHWVRDYERMVMTRPRGLLMDKKTGLVRVFQPGLVIRPAFLFTVTKVNIRIRTDIVNVKVMRPTADDQIEKWEYAATARWKINPEGEFPYLASEFYVDDVGEFARGAIQAAISNYLENTAATLTDLDTAGIYSACLESAQDELDKHGITWTELLPNDNTLADAEIQGNALQRVARAIERFSER